MNDRDWERFFDLVEKILKMPGTWQEKRDLVNREGERSSADWEEFISWFQND